MLAHIHRGLNGVQLTWQLACLSQIGDMNALGISVCPAKTRAYNVNYMPQRGRVESPSSGARRCQLQLSLPGPHQHGISITADSCKFGLNLARIHLTVDYERTESSSQNPILVIVNGFKLVSHISKRNYIQAVSFDQAVVGPAKE